MPELLSLKVYNSVFNLMYLSHVDSIKNKLPANVCPLVRKSLPAKLYTLFSQSASTDNINYTANNYTSSKNSKPTCSLQQHLIKSY